MDSRILNGLLGRRSDVTKSGDLMKNWTQRQITTSLLTVVKTHYPDKCNGRSIWMIDCRKFDDPDSNVNLRKHIGRNPRITRSIIESKNYNEPHRRLYDGMPRFFSSKNIVIMICRSGRHRSVANAEFWSNTLARYGRHQHSVSLLHLSELDFWKIRVHENVRNAANSLPEFSRHTTIASVLSVHDLPPSSNL